jgi:hypothetical protein
MLRDTLLPLLAEHPFLTLGVIWLARYLAVSVFWPFNSCGRCNGDGKLRAPWWANILATLLGRRPFRTCPRCKGSGRRTRLGPRLVKSFRDRYAATKTQVGSN